MKMPKCEHELSIIATEALVNLYKSLPNELSDQEFAEVLLELSQYLVGRARIAMLKEDTNDSG